MALVITPKRWDTKPPLGARINSGHPLAKGLYAAWLFNEPGGQQSTDLVQGIPVTSPDVSMSYVAPGGLCVGRSNNTQHFGTPNADPAWNNQALSAVIFRQETRTDGFGGIFALENLSSGNRGLQWGWAGAGTPLACNVTVGANVGMVGCNAPFNGPHVYGVTSGPSGLRLYLDGKLNTSSTTASAIWPYGDLKISLMADSEGGGNWGEGYIWYAYFWIGRELTDRDHAQLFADPYCFVQAQSPQRRLWVKGSSRLFTLNFGDAFTPVDSIKKITSKTVADNSSPIDSLKKLTSKIIDDGFSVTDSIAKKAAKSVSEALSVADSIARRTTKTITDTINPDDRLSKTIGKAYQDSINLTDSITKQIGKVFNDGLSLADSIQKSISKTFVNILNPTDSLTASLAKKFTAVRQFIAQTWQRLWQAEVNTRTWQAEIAIRIFGATEDMITEIFKPTDSVEDFQLDWTPINVTGDAVDAITESTWTVPTGMEKAEDSFTATSTIARLSGGTLGRTYIVTNDVTLTSGQVKSQSLQITITH